MCAVGAGFKLGVELHANEERVIHKLDVLHEVSLLVHTRNAHAVLFKRFPESVVELVAVPVALRDFALAIKRARNAALAKGTGVAAKALGTAKVVLWALSVTCWARKEEITMTFSVPQMLESLVMAGGPIGIFAVIAIVWASWCF